MTLLPLMLFFVPLLLLIVMAFSLWRLQKKTVDYEKHIAVIEATLVGVTKKITLLEAATVNSVTADQVVAPTSLLSLEDEQAELEQSADMFRTSDDEPCAERALIEKMKKITSP